MATYCVAVEPSGIEQVLASAEHGVETGRGVRGTGFRAAVDTVKGNPELAERYGERIAAVDEAAFRAWALLVVPITIGTVLAVAATVGGVLAVGWAYGLEGLAAVVVFYVGVAVLLVTTHGLAHLVVGRILGIRFSAWFIGTVRRPQPGVKVDYRTYLRAPATSRAWMHASGAIVTKLVPLALVGAAVAAGLPAWAMWGLVAISVASIVTDVIWSTKSSDWARFRREMALAQIS
jgi:hypothetical protein